MVGDHKLVAVVLPGSAWAFTWMLAMGQLAASLAEESAEAWKATDEDGPLLGSPEGRVVPARLLAVFEAAARFGAPARLDGDVTALGEMSVLLMRRLGYQLRESDHNFIRRAVRRVVTAHEGGFMSWSFSVAAGPAADFEAKAREAAHAYAEKYTASDEEKTAMWEQMEAAVDAAALILPTVQPEAEGWVSAFMSGHANPEHKPRQGWSDDTTSIQITQLQAPKPEGA